MGHVTGIGGFFFRANEPERLAGWYREHLGLEIGGSAIWEQQAGPTILAPMKVSTDYWDVSRSWMLNLRVDDLDGLLASLAEAGVEAITKPEWDTEETGRFARIHDPEGNALELWEPPAADRG